MPVQEEPMRGKREKLFECSYVTPTDEGRIVVPAWTPIEAASLAEEILQRAGVPLSGLVTVRDRRGLVVLQVPAHPLGPASASSAA